MSLESATLHPLQSLTDIITIQEQNSKLQDSKFKTQNCSYLGAHVKPLPQCVANSFAQWINAWGEG